MRKLFTAVIALALFAALAASPSSAMAKSYDFTLSQTSKINGTTLEAGKYKLELNGDSEAHIYKDKELVTKAPVEVKELKNGNTQASVLQDASGNVKEIRFKRQVVVFVR